MYPHVIHFTTRARRRWPRISLRVGGATASFA
jgi:hypothetical protein